MQTLSQPEARRIALAAQGFSGTARMRQRRPFDPALESLHVLQIDSVNVFARSHYMPMFSRHGGYDQERLDRHLWSSGEFTEYWAHEAAFIRVEDRPLFGWRMDDYRQRYASRIEELKPAGSTLMSFDSFANGRACRPGDLFLPLDQVLKGALE